jgi:RecA-family ATPase
MWPDRLTISTRWKRLNDGGARELVEWISSVPKPRLIILDTLASVRPINTRDGYAQDYAALEQVHRIANDYGIGIVVLHHQRKVEAQDPLDTISGTLGLAGCADTSLVLSGNSSGKSLYLRGRDVEEAEHAIQFDAQACRWKILGDAADVRRSETRNKILGVLKASDAPIGPKEIAEQSGLSEDVVKNRLLAMVKDGEVLKKGHGKYVLPD